MCTRTAREVRCAARVCGSFDEFERSCARKHQEEDRKLDIAGELRSVYSKMTADVLSSTGVSMKRVSVRETPRVIQWLGEVQ